MALEGGGWRERARAGVAGGGAAVEEEEEVDEEVDEDEKERKESERAVSSAAARPGRPSDDRGMLGPSIQIDAMGEAMGWLTVASYVAPPEIFGAPRGMLPRFPPACVRSGLDRAVLELVGCERRDSCDCGNAARDRLG